LVHASEHGRSSAQIYCGRVPSRCSHGHVTSAVEEYYRIAPAIVDAINAESDSAAEYERIRAEYLDRAVECIRRSDREPAEQIYVAMVENLVAKYGVERAAN